MHSVVNSLPVDFHVWRRRLRLAGRFAAAAACCTTAAWAPARRAASPPRACSTARRSLLRSRLAHFVHRPFQRPVAGPLFLVLLAQPNVVHVDLVADSAACERNRFAVGRPGWLKIIIRMPR